MGLIIFIAFMMGFNFLFWSLVGLLRFLSGPELRISLKKYRWLSLLLAAVGYAKPALLRLNAAYYGIINFFLSIKNAFSPKPKFPNFILTRIGEFGDEYGGMRGRCSAETMLINPEDVAAVVPAHNEEAVIAKTIISLRRIMPTGNIYVGDDASGDRTAQIAKELNVHVLSLHPNVGKANMLAFLIESLRLTKYYKAIMIVDADSEVDENYFKNALPLLGSPGVAAVAVHAESKWHDHFWPKKSMIFSAYRVRLYRVLQAMLRYGQTWKYMNATTIVPGYTALYRSAVLENIKINAPGLVIEDYNMTFEVHHKKLGKIVYSPRARSASQDPVNFRDYLKQVKRWNLGLWQTIKKHGVWPGFFWLFTGSYIVEVLFYSLFFFLLPPLLVWSALAPALALPILPGFGLSYLITFLSLVFLIDYCLTVIVAVYEKKPILLLYGPTFIILRYIDAMMFIYTLPLAFFSRSNGRWISPKRQAA